METGTLAPGQTPPPRLRAAFAALVVLAIVGIVGALVVHGRAERDARFRHANEALASLQSLVKSAGDAVQGKEPAFRELRESSAVVLGVVTSLKDGSGQVPQAPSSMRAQVDALMPMVSRIGNNAQTLLRQQSVLVEAGASLRAMQEQTTGLLAIGKDVSSQLARATAPAPEIAAAGQLVLLIQSIDKSAGEFAASISPEAVFQLGKDLNSFQEIAEGLLKASAATDPRIRQRLEELLAAFQKTRSRAGKVLGNLQGLVSARDAHAAIVADSPATRRGLEELARTLEAAR